MTDLISIFEKAGLELEQLTVSALALAEHIRDSIEATAVIDLEPGEMDVAVVAGRQLLFSRASGLDVTGAQPEIAARRLTDEIARSFTSFQNEYRQQALSHINISGPSVQGPEGFAVEQTLSSVLEMPISKLSSRLLPAGDSDALSYATALGVALQTRADNLASINLVPDERAIKRALAAQRQRRQLATLAGIAALVVGGVLLSNYVSASKAARAAQVAANDKLKKTTAILDARKKVYQTQSDLYTELTTGLDRDHPAIDVLVALNRALPPTPNIWLTQFAFDRNGLITLHGDTKSAGDATDMVIALQASGAFTDVKVAYLGDSQENPVPTNTPTPQAAAATPASSVPVNPLPGMGANPNGQMGGRFGGPGYGQNGMPNAMAQGGNFRGGAYGNGQGGMQGGYQPGVNYPPGQGYPGAPQGGGQFPNGQFPNGQFPNGQPNNGQFPNGQPQNGQFPNGQPNNGQFPNGQPQNGQPNNGQPIIITPAQPVQGNGGANILRFDPNGTTTIITQPVPQQTPPPPPPPFYLIGFGQDQTAAQIPNGTQNLNGGQDPNGQDPNGQDPNGGTGRRRGGRRNRNNGQGANGQGTDAQGNNFQNGNFQRGNRNRNNPNGNNMMNPGVTPYGPGSSNPMQNGSMQGGPVINPAAVQQTVQAAPVKPAAPVRKVVTAKPKGMLTSFIITCRLNPSARTLLTTQGLTPAKGIKRTQSTVAPTTRRPIGEDSDTSDHEGDTNGNSQ